MKLKYSIGVLLFCSSLSSCSLMGSLDDMEQEYVLTDETLITDQASAENALSGVYSTWKMFNLASFRDLMWLRCGSLASVELLDKADFQVNKIPADATSIENVYTQLYYVVASANSFIDRMEKSTPAGLSAERKEQMVGDAYFHKALAEFDLLRLFGEYYDLKSQYGIVVWNEPIRSDASRARSTVAKSYENILASLDKAAKVSGNGTSYRVSPLAVEALRARVLLNEGKYTEAARVAGELLAANDFLEQDYANIFRTPYETGEMLFTLYCSYPNQSFQGSGYFTYSMPGALLTAISDELVEGEGTFHRSGADYLAWLEQFREDADRYAEFVSFLEMIEVTEEDFNSFGEDDQKGCLEYYAESYGYTEEVPGGDPIPASGYDKRYVWMYDEPEGDLRMSKYQLPSQVVGVENTHYFIRMAEVYLIKAEAEARLTHYGLARTALKAITDRAGYDEDYTDGIADADLLNLIMQHKYVELSNENYEPYFDMVRHYKLDGVALGGSENMAAGKTLILPIPRSAMSGNPELTVNP